MYIILDLLSSSDYIIAHTAQPTMSTAAAPSKSPPKTPSKDSPPLLTNETIQQRLLTGASSKGGARGSLTRCATKLGALHAKLSAPGGSTDQEIQVIKEELQREVKLFQVELRKSMMMIRSGQSEFKQAQQQEQEMAQQVAKKQAQIQELRQQAAKVARTRLCWQEYETLAKLARQRPPRRVLQAKMKKADADLETTSKQLYETAAESKVREKQFHLLIQCMLDLKRSLGEVVEIPPPPKEKQAEKEEEEQQSTTQQQQTGKSSDGTVSKEESVPKEEASSPKEEDNPDEAKLQPKQSSQPMEVEVEEDDDLYSGL